MFDRIREMLIKEFIHVLRDKRMRVVMFVFPCIQVLIIGYAVTTDVRDVPTALYDLDHSDASRALEDRFLRSGYFHLVERTVSPDRMQELVDRGIVSLVIVVRRGFQDDLLAGRTAQVQLIVDGSDSNTAGVVLGYARSILAAHSQQIIADRVSRTAGIGRRPAWVELQSRAWFNVNLESRNYFVPGVIVIIVALITLLLTSMSVVREKEIGTIEQIMVTPIRPVEFVLGKTVPFALIGFFDVLLITVIGVFWFDVPVRGSLVLLFFATALFLLTTLGVGLLISTISATQQQAMMATFFFFMPAMMLSGFVFPIASMPAVAQWITYVNPLRYFLIIVRGIFLKGVGFETLWPEMLSLAVMGVLIQITVARRFRKTL